MATSYVSGAEDLDRVCELGALGNSGNQPSHGNRIAADVEDGSAAEIRVKKAPIWIDLISSAEPERGPNHPYLPDFAPLENLNEGRGLRVTSIHECFHEENFVLAGRCDDGHALSVVQRHRFLADNMFARLRGAHCPLGVKRMWRGDIDRLHFRVGQKRCVTGMPVRNLELIGERIGRFFGAGSDGDR